MTTLKPLQSNIWQYPVAPATEAEAKLTINGRLRHEYRMFISLHRRTLMKEDNIYWPQQSMISWTFQHQQFKNRKQQDTVASMSSWQSCSQQWAQLLSIHSSGHNLKTRHSSKHSLLARHNSEHNLHPRHSNEHDQLTRHGSEHNLLARHSSEHNLLAIHSSEHNLLVRRSSEHNLLAIYSSEHNLLTRHSSEHNLAGHTQQWAQPKTHLSITYWLYTAVSTTYWPYTVVSTTCW